jgi:hypothetical protein
VAYAKKNKSNIQWLREKNLLLSPAAFRRCFLSLTNQHVR